MKEGDILVDRFEIAARLGRGGMGEVFTARDRKLGREVAVKALLAQQADAEMIGRVRQEARALAAVKHAAVVEIYDLIEHGDDVFIVMEKLDGEPLDARFAARGRMALEDAIALASSLLDGLAAVHDAGIVHRDLKPANVFLQRGADGREHVRLLDFGVSRPRAGESVVRTVEGSVIGSALYMAPEQAKGAPECGPAVDQWSVGVILYEALTGRTPFIAESWFHALTQLVTETAPPLRTFAPDVPERVASVVDRALRSEASERHTSVRAMREALLDALAVAHAPDAHAVAERATGSSDRVAVIAKPSDLPAKRAVPQGGARLRAALPIVLVACGLFLVLAAAALAVRESPRADGRTSQDDLAAQAARADVTPDVGPISRLAVRSVPSPADMNDHAASATLESRDASTIASGTLPSPRPRTKVMREAMTTAPASSGAAAPAAASASAAPPSLPSASGRVMVSTEDGARVAVEGRSERATARFRRAGEHARVVLVLPAGTHWIRCTIPGEMDPVRVRVVVRPDEDTRASCFR